MPLSIPDPLNPRYSYAAGKIISEIMAINYGHKDFDRVVIFRPHNVYGPDMGWEHVIPQFAVRMKALCDQADDTLLRFPSREAAGKRGPLFSSTISRKGSCASSKKLAPGIYNIGTMEEITIEQLAIKMGA